VLFAFVSEKGSLPDSILSSDYFLCIENHKKRYSYFGVKK
jgi:hypothetical protein